LTLGPVVSAAIVPVPGMGVPGPIMSLPLNPHLEPNSPGLIEPLREHMKGGCVVTRVFTTHPEGKAGWLQPTLTTPLTLSSLMSRLPDSKVWEKIHQLQDQTARFKSQLFPSPFNPGSRFSLT
jgi:hypothetical protein